MSKLQLISVKELQNEVKALLTRKLEVTLSLAYYSMINGNSAPLKGFDKDITSELDSKTKQFICAKFDKKSNDWTYSKEKATKMLARLGLTFQKCEWDDFVAAIHKDLEIPPAELTAEEQKALDYKQGKAGVSKAIEKLVKAGLNLVQIQAIIGDAILGVSMATPAVKQAQIAKDAA